MHLKRPQTQHRGAAGRRKINITDDRDYTGTIKNDFQYAKKLKSSMHTSTTSQTTKARSFSI